MSNNPFYILFASHRSVAPTILRWTLALVLLLEIARAALWSAGMIHWQGGWEPMFKTFVTNLPPLLTTPFALARIVVAAGLLLGFLTRLWAVLTIALALFGYQSHGMMIDHSSLLESLIVVCGAAAALVLLGGGRGSLDEVISRHLLPRVG